MDAAIWTILGTSITGTTIAILQYIREGRAHRWIVEQSERDSKERIKIATRLKAVTHKNARALANKITENTIVNEAALLAGKEAWEISNNLSLKMKEQGLKLRGIKSRNPKTTYVRRSK